MKLSYWVAICAMVVSTAAQADAALAQSKSCMACHAIDKKLIGPSYKDVAKKYASDKDAATKLAASIKAGGAGKWGQIPMPAQAALSDADAKTLAAWVMGAAK